MFPTRTGIQINGGSSLFENQMFLVFTTNDIKENLINKMDVLFMEFKNMICKKFTKQNDLVKIT